MIGSQLVKMLVKRGAKVRITVHSRSPEENLSDVLSQLQIIKGDLTMRDFCIDAVKDIDTVFHLAAFVGGIGRNVNYPAEMYTPNMLMNTQVLEAARLADVEEYLYTSSACVYPANAKIPIKEKEVLRGPPEPTNAVYGWVKRMGELQAQVYAEEYGMNIAIVRPFNAYGPGDNFDLETSHVIPALIKKAFARQDPFIVWGDGSPSRDFVYSADIARGMLLAMEKYTCADPVNIGTGVETRIKDLVNLILHLTGHIPNEIRYEKKKLLGQRRRKADTTKAREKLAFEAEVSIEEGLRRTIEWYRRHYL